MATITVSEFRASIPKRIEALKKWAAFECFLGVVRKNPVDTGRSRAWWTIAVGSADLRPGPDAPRTGKLPPPTAPPIGHIPPGVPVIVSNNIVYIERLERGHSKQAPNGMARVTVLEVQQKMDRGAAIVRLEYEGGAGGAR